MKSISLTKGKIALVDDEDFERFNQWKWQAKWNKYTRSYYACRKEGSVIRKTVYLHRLIMNTPIGMVCDHINHDTLDCRKSNLRNVTVSQNQINRKGAQSNNNLGVLGVGRHGNGFRAHITVNGKVHRFQTRSTIEEAIADRKEAERKYYSQGRA